MGAGLAFVLVVLIICVSILFGYYMELCSDNEVKMFANPKYEQRIRELEQKVRELEEKKK